MARELLVFADKIFKITVPDDCKVTFGPWSPPPRQGKGMWDEQSKRGTLRIYRGTEKNIVAVFTNVVSFRDLSMGYAEQVAKEEGATIWKSDEHGYMREDKVNMKKEWIEPTLPPKQLGAGELEEPKARRKK